MVFSILAVGGSVSLQVIKFYRSKHKHTNKMKLGKISKDQYRASLVVQWLRIHLPVQGTWVRALVWEDPICRGATKPVHHDC